MSDTNEPNTNTNEPDSDTNDTDSDSDYDSDSDADDELEVKLRTCTYQKEHLYTDRAYKCEDCHKQFCKECVLDDEWEDRVRDNVFLCLICYHIDQRIQDIG